MEPEPGRGRHGAPHEPASESGAAVRGGDVEADHRRTVVGGAGIEGIEAQPGRDRAVRRDCYPQGSVGHLVGDEPGATGLDRHGFKVRGHLPAGNGRVVNIDDRGQVRLDGVAHGVSVRPHGREVGGVGAALNLENGGQDFFPRKSKPMLPIGVRPCQCRRSPDFGSRRSTISKPGGLASVVTGRYR